MPFSPSKKLILAKKALAFSSFPLLKNKGMGRVKRKRAPYFFAASIGNLFEHYDKHLFAFLAPFLAPLFFQTKSPLLSLILTFGIMPLSLLSRPLGALIFGKIGDRQGRKKALTITLMGMAFVTLLMGILPTYQQAGWIAPLLLILTRLLQSFFASGEITGGALLILEHCDPKKRSFLSSIYDCSSILGILIASFAVTLLAHFNCIASTWRLLYLGGAVTACIGMGLRLFTREDELPLKREDPLSTAQLIWKERRIFLALCFGIGFSYAIYENATTLMHSYLPFISRLSQVDSAWMSTWILILDLCLLPIFGYLAMRLSYQKTMLFFLFLTITLAFPLFNSLKEAAVFSVLAVRILFVILGVGFSAPLYAWAIETTPSPHRYTLISLSTAIGSQLIGGGSCVISLWLFEQTGWAGSPGLYLSLIGAITFFAMQNKVKKPALHERGDLV